MNRFHRWYDAVREPWRIILLVLSVTVGLVLLASDATLMRLFGVIWVAFLARVVVSRVLYATDLAKAEQERREMLVEQTDADFSWNELEKGNEES
jgi:hypothetical protein